MARIERVDPSVWEESVQEENRKRGHRLYLAKRRRDSIKLYGEQIGPAFIDLLELPHTTFLHSEAFKNEVEARRRLIHYIAEEAGNPDVAIRERAFNAFSDLMSRGLLNNRFLINPKF
jgi:hypothetical protein